MQNANSHSTAPFGPLAMRTRLYWTPIYYLLVVSVGAACSLRVFANWDIQRENGSRLLFLAVVAVIVSGFKIRLPGVTTTLSTNYVVILAALLDLDAGAGVVVSLICTLAQCLLYANTKPRWYQVVFSVVAVPLPVLGADLLIHSVTLRHLDGSGSVGLLAGVMTYFLINTITVAGVISLTSNKAVRQVWQESYLWTFPQYLVGGLIAAGIHFLDRNLGWAGILVAAPPLYLLYRSFFIYLGKVQEQKKHIAEMAALHLRTIETLALAIDAKDDKTAAHLRRVQIYATEIGRELDLSSEEIDALNAAALLHDVGKLAVPEYIVSKPGKLTPDEFEKMKVHPVVGAEILERVGFPYPVVPIVRSHHEKYDGTGYPDGLKGEDIPIGARILSAVDSLDALSSDRPYRKALPLEEAMRMVAAESGKAFDPRIVDLLQRKYPKFEEFANEQTAPSARLSTNVRVVRGLAPAAGFAETKPARVDSSGAQGDFSMSIVSARREIQLLTEVINDLGNSLSLKDTLALLAVRLEQAVRHDAVAIYLLDGEKLMPRFVKGESYRLFSSLEIPVGEGLSGWAAKHQTPILNGNPAVEAGYLNDPSRLTTLRSGLAVPLISERGLVGVLTVYAMGAEAFTGDDRRLLLAIAPKAAHAIENSLRFEIAASAADTDELTGLANARSLFAHLQRRVASCARAGNTFAVIVLDLDGFKQANDAHGHMAGNRILQSVAAGLVRNTRAGDLVARLGGDEFVAVLEGTEERWTEYEERIKEISHGLGSEARCDATVTISAGSAVFPADGEDAEALLSCADERMYAAKRGKKMALVA